MIRTTKEDYAQVIPSVSKTITCHHKTMKRFDSILEDTDLIDYQLDQARCRSLNSLATGTKGATEQQSETSTISISMPPTPSSKGVGFNEIYSQTSTPRGTTTTQNNKRISSYSQTSTPRGLILLRHGLVDWRDNYQLSAERNKNLFLNQVLRSKLFPSIDILMPWKDLNWTP